MNSNAIATSNPTDLRPLLEGRLAELDPGLELVLLERPSAGVLRLFIDHPHGVDLALCERVNEHLADLRDELSLEVSSPGLDRPLTKPEHFSRFLGRRATLRSRAPIGGRRNFRGTLKTADDEGVTLLTDEGPLTIPHGEIERSNLVAESFGGGR